MENTQSIPRRPLSALEPLEQRIAPAPLTGWVGAVTGSPMRLEAGTANAGLSTSDQGGSYLLYVHKGYALVYTTDLNANNKVDFNEITGIAAGPGLQLTSFVDIHGDIVTNLKPDFTLTDSDGNAGNGRDGRVLLPSKIEKIELRSITAADLPTGVSVSDRLALSSYSIFGNIHAGGGFGIDKGGLLINTTGASAQAQKYPGGTGTAKYEPSTPQIGSIFAGSAASYEAFSFGTARPGEGLGFMKGNIRGELRPFVPAAGVDGADIIGVRPADDSMLFNLGTLKAGNGGSGGRGGDIKDVRIPGDKAGGYTLTAGDAGKGIAGQRGGNISNFADLGSQTGFITLNTGRGGDSLLGVGGDGGLITFNQGAPQNFSARIAFNLGDGGTGLTGGGKGGGMPNAKITMPANDPTYPLAMVSSVHRPGGVGVADPLSLKLGGFDFDKDGRNDAVYTTADPNQLVVLFGFAGGGFDPLKTIRLDGPANASAVTVGDFNGDGFDDIATASGNASSAGVYVFLSTKDRTDPTRFTGFAQPVMTPLPAYKNVGALEKSVPIISLASGEFDGEAGVDLAVVSVQESRIEGSPDGPTLTFLSNDGGSGYFYSGKPADYNVVAPDAPFVKASALQVGDFVDRVSFAVKGPPEDPTARSVVFYDFSSGLKTPALALGTVDVDREFSDLTKTPPEIRISLVPATLQDWTVIDANGDGSADLVALTESPLGFLITFSGDGTGNFTLKSSPLGAENSGIKVVGNLGGTDRGLGWLVGSTKGILASRNTGTGLMDQITLVSYELNLATSLAKSPFVEVRLTPDMDAATLGASYGVPVGEEDVRSFDIYAPVQNPIGINSYLLAAPSKDPSPVTKHQNFIFGYGGTAGPFGNGYLGNQMDYELLVTAGSGGRGLTGAGGAGGIVGDKLVNSQGVVRGSFDVLLPNTEEHGYSVGFNSGHGGRGFLNGGAGGSIKGLSVEYPLEVDLLASTVALRAGSGGDSATGIGGRGGELSDFIVESGRVFASGAGGSGYKGGAGGSIRGNVPQGLDPIVANTSDPYVFAYAGDGGSGLSDGGAGGSIVNLKARFLAVIGGERGQMDYVAGDGGPSVSGKGGAGGSVTGSSPADGGNNLGGTVYLRAGDGGKGASGGDGGAVSEFYNQPTTGTPPSALNITAGNGGVGVSGSGGTGGTVSKVNASAKGVGVAFDEFGFPLGAYLYNRILAGNGGDSTGANGGLGGSLIEVTSSASGSSLVAAAGRGGDGLAVGGLGGSVAGNSKARLSLNAAGGAKLLVIAGDGGNAAAALRSDFDPLAYGPADGKAGNGGSISYLTQPQSISTRVDLIAGNGGNTPNYGTSSSQTGVGNGGSITHVDIAGDIGNVSASVAIKSYNNIKNNERIADFVQAAVREDLSADLTDFVGNVGIVVGSNGRVRDNNQDGLLDPSGSGTTGVLTDIKFRNLMSAVAGSVDRINSIREVSRVTSTQGTGAVYGADKDPTGPVFNYISADAVLNWLKTPAAARPTVTQVRPEIGGALVDGAIIHSNAPITLGDRDFVLG